jgi:hypothetical protein
MSASAHAAVNFVPYVFNSGTDRDLGVIPSIVAFFEALGTNSSNWAVLPSDAEDETLNEELLVETSPNNNPVANSLVARAVSGSFAGPGAPQIVEGGVITRRQSDDYNILLTVERMTSARTVAPASCIARVLMAFLKRGSENFRHSCQPMHNQGSWHSMVGIHINQGRYNTYLPNRCCY